MTSEKPDDFPEPPSHLTPSSRELWQTLGPLHAPTAGLRALFLLGLECLDRCEMARQAIATDGLTGGSGKMRHTNPCIKIEAESRAQVIEIWKVLGVVDLAAQASPKGEDLDAFLSDCLKGVTRTRRR